MRRFFRVMMVCAVLATGAQTAPAHDLKMTGLKVRLDKSSVTVGVVAHLHALSSGDPAAELSRRLKLRLDGKPFVPDKVRLVRDQKNGLVIWQAQRPVKASWVAVDAPLFPEKQGETTVVTVFRDGRALGEAVLDSSQLTAVIGKPGAEQSINGVAGVKPDAVGANRVLDVAGRFLREGVVHIFLGPDHVLFLLSLLLLGGTWMQLLKIVTSFTLAHSVTLSLAATGVFALAPRFVEPVIALSIVAVAVINLCTPAVKPTAQPENAYPETVTKPAARDFRPWLAFGFGLIHGFGFAGALAEVGLPRESLGWALLSFNVGVEIGQAILVLIFAPALAWLVKARPRLQAPIVLCGSLAVAFMGAFWFAQRLFSA
jgi:hypothetical protein